MGVQLIRSCCSADPDKVVSSPDKTTNTLEYIGDLSNVKSPKPLKQVDLASLLNSTCAQSIRFITQKMKTYF